MLRAVLRKKRCSLNYREFSTVWPCIATILPRIPGAKRYNREDEQSVPDSHVFSESIGGGVDAAVAIHAVAGDVLAMRPMTSHGSGASDPKTRRHRRTLNFEFAADYERPDGYRWNSFIQNTQNDMVNPESLSNDYFDFAFILFVRQLELGLISPVIENDILADCITDHLRQCSHACAKKSFEVVGSQQFWFDQVGAKERVELGR